MDGHFGSTVKHCILGVLTAFICGSVIVLDFTFSELNSKFNVCEVELSFIKQRFEDLETKVGMLEKMYEGCEDISISKDKETGNVHLMELTNTLQKRIDDMERYLNMKKFEIPFEDRLYDVMKKVLKGKEFTSQINNLHEAGTRVQPAFHTRLAKSIEKIGFQQTVIFDHEVVDTTNSYDPRSGIFTVPLTGLYVFYWNLLTTEASGMDTTLDSSKGPIGFGFISHAVNYANGGNMVIANLTSGTHVWVKKADRYGNYLHERFSTFSGYLLYASITFGQETG